MLSSMCLPGVSIQFVGGPTISYTIHLGVSMCFPLVLWCLIEFHTLVGKSGYRLHIFILGCPKQNLIHSQENSQGERP